MPYMFSQGAANVLCTLLHFVNDELVDVAKGKIVQPGSRVFHGNQMPPTVYRLNWFGCCRASTTCYLLIDPMGPTKMM